MSDVDVDPERLVIVIEYDVTGDMQRALNDAMEQIREGADRLNPERVKVVGVHVGVEDFVDRVLALFAKDADVPDKAIPAPTEGDAP